MSLFKKELVEHVTSVKEAQKKLTTTIQPLSKLILYIKIGVILSVCSPLSPLIVVIAPETRMICSCPLYSSIRVY